jgi:hypothetical protein
MSPAEVAARACVEEEPEEVELQMLQGGEAGAGGRVLVLELVVQKTVFELLLRWLTHFGVRRGLRGPVAGTVRTHVCNY